MGYNPQIFRPAQGSLMGTSKPQPQIRPTEASDARLDSWKEIAAYLKRDERTVRRWEAEGLPVRRKVHKKQASVYAYKGEIDTWWDAGQHLELAEPVDSRKGLALKALAGLVTASLILIVALNVSRIRDWLKGNVATAPAIRSLAVLPLQNLSGDPAQEYLADGMTEELIGRLAGIRNLRVISRTSVMHFKDTQLSVPEIAKTLRADAVVEGSVIREGSRIRVHAQLVRGSERHRLVAVRPISPEVYENYLKGRFALAKSNSRTNIEESIAYFNEAIRKDSTFAPSYVGLANAYSDLATVFVGGVAKQERPRAILAARQAVQLDPELVEAHVLLADMAQQQWRWAEAESEYQRVLDLSPNNAAANSALAYWLVSQGRTEEAVTACRRGREIDPIAVPGSDLAWMLFYARRYNDAVNEARSVLGVTPDDAFAGWILGFALIANHHPQEAVTVLEKAVSASDRSPAIVGLLVHAYAQAGHRADALGLLEELKRRRRTGYVPAAALILAYLGLGEYDQAFLWLQEAYKEQSNILQFLKVHPFFDPFRDDPRCKDLLRRIGLPE